jgi:RNA-binding protein NOB1
VLSTADLHVIALTYALHEEHAARKLATEKVNQTSRSVSAASKFSQEELATVKAVSEVTPSQSESTREAEEVSQPVDEPISPEAEEVSEDLEALVEEFERMPLDATDVISGSVKPTRGTQPDEAEAVVLYDDPSEPEDGQGDWITPENVALFKSRALDLLPDAAGKSKSKKRKALPQPERVDVGCMTADYAMQNVLIHMGLNLVGVEGTRISSVKSWVLRCHACFK